MASEMKRLKPASLSFFSAAWRSAPGSEHADLLITKGLPLVGFLREVGRLIPKMTIFRSACPGNGVLSNLSFSS